MVWYSVKIQVKTFEDTWSHGLPGSAFYPEVLVLGLKHPTDGERKAKPINPLAPADMNNPSEWEFFSR
jgi:hypothetical protein